MQKEIKTEEWKMILPWSVFFLGFNYLFISEAIKYNSYTEWPIYTVGMIAFILLFSEILTRKIYFLEDGLVFRDTKDRIKQVMYQNRFVPWSMIKHVKMTTEDSSKYIFGRNKKRGHIILQTGNEHIELSYVLNPEQVLSEINSYISNSKKINPVV